MLSETEGQLIFYKGRDTTEPGIWMSRYFVYETSDPRTLGNVLKRALGIYTRIRKRRLHWAAHKRVAPDK